MGGRADHSDSLYENHLGIAPHIPVMDKSKRDDGSFSPEDFTFDKERNVYICPAGKTGRVTNVSRRGFWEISAKISKLPGSLQQPPFSLLPFLGGGR